MKNIPEVKIGIVGVSRDCFPAELTVRRRAAVAASYGAKYDASEIYECPVTIIESEIDMVNALEDVKNAGCNALCVYLGNFGPEISETLLAKHFDGPVMFCAAAEETQNDLVGGRGDAFCGMLNASYNLALRNTKAYIPEEPCGDAEDCADMIHEFLPIARVKIALSDLKIISFGPRPSNFMACNAPIKSLFDLDVEIEEESELDLFEAYQKHEGDARIADVVADMAAEMGYEAGKGPDMLTKLAQYELTLLDWVEEHKGYRKYVALTTKCWPAFQDMFHFVPCYVNSRLMKQGIPVSCEVDIYGTLSEYIGLCLAQDEVTLLDINNSVPKDMYEESIKGTFDYMHSDTFMGFHCGNTCSTKLLDPHLSYQRIMANTHPKEWCDGTIEGDIKPGEITFYRLQSTADSKLRAYVAEGEVLPVATRSFGSIGVFAIPQFGRFYRYWLIEKNFPHHGAVMFGHFGKVLYETLKFLGVDVSEIGYNRPASERYEGENPFSRSEAPMLYIGIDLGTSAVKLLLMDEKGNIRKTVSREYPLHFPKPGWSEQDPADWYNETISGIGELLKNEDRSQVDGISFGGQMHGLVTLDADGNVIRPAILWNDGRTQKETEYLNETIGEEKLAACTGNIAFAGFTAPKILWMRENEPENFARISKIMLPKDYLCYCLSGAFATDYSDASGMLLLDVAKKCWSPEMLEICGITQEQLPKLYESHEVVGTVREDIAAVLGLPSGVKVIAGAGDNAAAAIGTGVTGEGMCNISLGTSGTLFVSSDSFTDPGNHALHSFCHADSKWHLMGCMLSAASCNKWWCEEILHTEHYDREQRRINLHDDHDVYFLPYLMGERSPHNDPAARGAFIGMHMDTSRNDMTRAMLEGVAFGLRDSLEIARNKGIEIKRARLCGGGAKSPLWRKIIANVLDLTLEIPEVEEGPSLGAAMLAAVGCGTFRDVAEATAAVTHVSEEISPEPELTAMYNEKYQKWCSFYPALKGLF